MAITETITCDVCGKQKQQTNHWWMYDRPLKAYPDSGFVVWQWDDKHAKQYKSACGQECITKAVNEWMQEPK